MCTPREDPFLYTPTPLCHFLSPSVTISPFLALPPTHLTPTLFSFLILLSRSLPLSSHSVRLNVRVSFEPDWLFPRAHKAAAERNSPSKNRPVGLTNPLPLSFRLLSQRARDRGLYSKREWAAVPTLKHLIKETVQHRVSTHVDGERQREMRLISGLDVFEKHL